MTFQEIRGAKGLKKQLGLTSSLDLMKELFVDLRRGTGATVLSSAGGAQQPSREENTKTASSPTASSPDSKKKKLTSTRTDKS